MYGRVVQEQVFAYASSIEFDSAAFDAFFPVAGLPPAEHPRPLTTQTEPAASPLRHKRSRKKAAPKKQPRRKAEYQSAPTLWARAVRAVIFAEKKYPTKDQMAWPELRNAGLLAEYERYMKDYPSKAICEAATKADYARRTERAHGARFRRGYSPAPANRQDSASSADLARP